jgi:hypothetical protein
MHPRDCPQNWEYETHPDKDALLGPRSLEVVKNLRTGQLPGLPLAEDSRPLHARLFAGLTPPGCDYFAGNYRGSSHRCLEYYQVGIQSDPRVGAPFNMVAGLMDELRSEIRTSLIALDAAHQLPNSQVPREVKLLTTAVVACRVLELFLRIHPYANGNGHTARIIVLAILGRYGYWPAKWTIEPRPETLPYYKMITEERDGNPEFCEQQMVQCMSGDQAPP